MSGRSDKEKWKTADDIEAVIAWLEALAGDPSELIAMDPEQNRRLRAAAGRIALPGRLERRRHAHVRRQQEARDRRAHDEAALESTSHRASKRALAFPAPPRSLEIDPEHRVLLERQARVRPRDERAQRLQVPQSCYVCKKDYSELHHHYDSMCPECATLNWAKRHQTADLSGRVALVTGARVKIGFEIACMLLRAGARVVATTRFACDGARRFESESDFHVWADRLELVPLDLRNTPALEAFCSDRLERGGRLDFLVHNACQTVRRPPAYYEEMVAGEDFEALSSRGQQLLAGGRESDPAEPGALVARRAPDAVAALSQLDLLQEASQSHLFPAGLRDGEGQQLDLRERNSWRLDLHEVSTIELLEVQLVNAVAPFVLNARLKPLMQQVETRDAHIVHVSAMEGQFYRTFKTTRHPHTNMAKAALNMLTRTSAADYVRDGIHMNSVDTGWVTDEDPFAKTVEKADEQGFSPPLDSVDGAARVLDPIFMGLNTGEHCWGQFLKDYQPTRW